MGHITAMVLDAAEIWAYECQLPDDWHSAHVAARLAELIKLPSVGPDNYPINYGLVQMRGRTIDPQTRLDEIELPEHPIFRIVPEIAAGQETLGFAFDECATVEEKRAKRTDVKILAERLITEEVRLDLKPDVRIDAVVHRQIEEFVSRDRQSECAGLLLGTVTAEQHERAIHIKAAVPAQDAEGSRTSVKIGLNAWGQMLLVRDRQHDSLDVLGWFHTHAGWGVFMSDSDVFIHRHFFRHPNMVAYVIDPTMGKDGFFYWHGGSISLCPNYGLVGAASTVRRQKDKSKRRPGRILRNILIALILAVSLCIAAARLPMFGKMLGVLHPAPTAHTRMHKQPVELVEIKTQVYTFRRGETLWRVCRRFYGDAELAEALAKYNGIESLRSIQIGQEINIPPKEELEAR